MSKRPYKVACCRRRTKPSLRVSAAEKELLTRAAAMERTKLSNFVARAAIKAAREVINRSKRLKLSERDSLRVLDLIENPPAPNTRLLAAARNLYCR